MQNLAISKPGDCLELVLNPSPTAFVRVSGSETCASYLSKCRQNILAELWGFYRSKINPRFPNWRAVGMDTVHMSVRGKKVVLLDGAELEKELAWNMVLYRDRLCALCPRRDDEGNSHLTLVEGRRITDPYDSGSYEFCHVLGYIRPYVRELEAIAGLGKEAPPILKDVAAPLTRAGFDFHSGRPFSGTVPSNELQRSIIGALGSTLECIQGPPGTGKSTTIFHIVHTRLPDDHRAIVTCVQNKAVDSIAEKLGPNVSELPFVVYGRPGRMGDEAARFTVDAQAQRCGEVARIRRAMDRCEKIHRLLRARLDSLLNARIPSSRVYWVRRCEECQPQDGDIVRVIKVKCSDPWRRWWEAHVRSRHARLVADIAAWRGQFDEHHRELPSAVMAATTRIAESARVVLCTLDGLASVDLCGGKTIAILDEAGTVPEFKIPLLVSLGAKAIVAIGDQKQLRPFTHDTEDVQTGFFQRAVGALGTVPMLREQYRMHSDICAFVSEHFYMGELMTNPAIAAARAGGGISWKDYPDSAAESSDAKKRFNPIEVHILTRFMDEELPGLLKRGKSVAVITFYKHQFQCLMEAAEGLGLARTRQEMKELAKKKSALTRFRDPNFRIVTVDAAQGSEADVVVLSCVRCNARGDLGFLTNRNRMCVALSRARELLLVVGSSRTLSTDPVWRALYERVDK